MSLRPEKYIWIFLSVLSVVDVARTEETATEEVTKQDPSVWVDGWASFWFGNGYLSSSGNLSDTEPVAEQDVLFNLRTRDYGWLSFESWMKQDLHDKQSASHRRYFYIYEGLLTYGYAYAFADDLKLVTDADDEYDRFRRRQRRIHRMHLVGYVVSAILILIGMLLFGH